jgi:hypothetical protein
VLRIQHQHREHLMLQATQSHAQEVPHDLWRAQHFASLHLLPEQRLRRMEHFVRLCRPVRARDIANEENRRPSGRDKIVCHGRLRASGGIARDVASTAQHSRQGSKTAAGREHAAKLRAQTLTASTPWYVEGAASHPAPPSADTSKRSAQA